MEILVPNQGYGPFLTTSGLELNFPELLTQQGTNCCPVNPERISRMHTGRKA